MIGSTSLLGALPRQVVEGRGKSVKSPPPQVQATAFFKEERQASEKRCEELDRKIAALREKLAKPS